MAETARHVLRPVDEGARRLARGLVRAARWGALAALRPGDAGPLASRVLAASDDVGNPLLLVSDLAAHAAALRAHPRCSILFGDVGRGDPLAQPRISVFGTAETLDDDDRKRARDRFLARHPSAETYCDFADFRFVRIRLSGASLNAGFARAYELTAADLLDGPRPHFRERLDRAVLHMNADHADAVDAIAAAHGRCEGTGWRIVTADPSGFEIARDDALVRIVFDRSLETVDDIRPAFVGLAKSA